MFSRDPSTGKRKVPAWLAHYTNPRELKVWVRCVIASWVASLLMYILPSLRTIGTATFFAWYVCLIEMEDYTNYVVSFSLSSPHRGLCPSLSSSV